MDLKCFDGSPLVIDGIAPREFTIVERGQSRVVVGWETQPLFASFSISKSVSVVEGKYVLPSGWHLDSHEA
jgi:hypothetical protein